MAPTLLYVVLTVAISVQATLGLNNVECEYLNEDSCTYAVSSVGKRCVLEKRLVGLGYTCRASEIMADNLDNYVESKECVEACGVDRKALGISSDSLLDRSFISSLCSSKCYRNCPNIVDLYFNLAAGEGVYLPTFCESRRTNNDGGRREMLGFNSGRGLGRAASSPTITPLEESAAAIEAEDALATSPWASPDDGTTIEESAILSDSDASSPSPMGF